MEEEWKMRGRVSGAESERRKGGLWDFFDCGARKVIDIIAEILINMSLSASVFELNFETFLAF